MGKNVTGFQHSIIPTFHYSTNPLQKQIQGKRSLILMGCKPSEKITDLKPPSQKTPPGGPPTTTPPSRKMLSPDGKKCALPHR
jgi:hypothetical protein